MKRWKDPFPPTPQSFHDRVEQTLRGLEEMEMRKNHRYKRLTVLLIAAILALLAVGAVAAVIGSNRLKQDLTDAGATDMAGRVQDVHLTDSGDGFSFSIDEAVWEDQELYLSYTLSVPDDGNTYLLGLLVPIINGEPADYRSSCYLNDFFCTATALGGGFPTTDSFVLPVVADARTLELKDMKLDVSAAFFVANRPLEYIPDFFNEDGDYGHPERMTHWDGGIVEQEIFRSADTLCYWSQDAYDAPQIELNMFPEVLKAMAAKDAEAKGHVVIRYDAKGWPQIGLTPAGLDSTGIATLLAERGVSLPLSRDMVSHDLYNGLAQDTFRYGDATVVIEDFRMTHFELTANIWYIPDAGVPESDANVDFSVYPDLSLSVNGKLLSGSCFGGLETAREGVRGYCEQYQCFDYIPLGNLESLELVRCRYDEETRDFVVEDVVAKLTPVLDETAAEAEAAALATRIAAANWQPGDADITVWATDRGTYYHIDPDCSGMRSPHPWAIADAVEAGKKPCPACIGGNDNPTVLKEDEDISSLSD